MSKLKEMLKKLWQPELRWFFLATLLFAFIAGYYINSGPAEMVQHGDHMHDAAESAEVWTCSMHPQIRQPNPGQCPICGMDLIPVQNDGDDLGPREIRLSESAIKLAEIQTAPVQRKLVAREIRMAGKIDFDETRLKYISAYVPGRIDRLFVDYTGTSVRKGDHLVDLYSPELISAQEELLQAKKTLQTIGASSGIRESLERTVTAVREKLRLWGLTNQQIQAIEKRNTPLDRLTIYSPISGVVIHRNATEGLYITTGSRIYTVADLSYLWVKLDAYESDLSWLRYGQQVEFSTEAYPGETFSGRIAFIDPVLDARTRTIKVRVNVHNPQQRLKPEMFVRATAYSTASPGGKVIDPALAGKWISPMHPEIIKDGPGSCDICGMALVKASELGYSSADKIAKEAPLIIPASAPLITGTRAVVYVKVAGKQGVFAGREITLGPRAGDNFIVTAGLSEGEEVVTNGNFKLDSDLQIKAKPSMMNPEGGGPAPGHNHGGHNAAAPQDEAPLMPGGSPPKFQKALDKPLNAYFAMQKALSGDQLEATQKEAANFLKNLQDLPMDVLSNQARQQWKSLQKELQVQGRGIGGAEDLAAARKSFQVLTGHLTGVIRQFGVSGDNEVNRMYCPMAFDNKGAHWLQSNQQVANPYFGAAMLKCGEMVEQLAAGKNQKPREDNHEGHQHD